MMQTWWIDKQTGTRALPQFMSRSTDSDSADPSCPLALSEGRFGSLLSTRCQVPDQLDKDTVDGLTEGNTSNGVMVGVTVVHVKVGRR